MVDHVVGSREAISYQDEFLCRCILSRGPSSSLGALSSVLHLMREPPDAVLHRAPRPEVNLIGWDQSSGLCHEGETGLDETLGELPQVTGQSDGAVAGHQCLVLPGLGNGYHLSGPPLSGRGRPRSATTS